MLQKSYSELTTVSHKRLSDLEMLQDFIQSATAELIWLNEKEEVEVSRDWSSKSLNVAEIQRYYEVNGRLGVTHAASERTGARDARPAITHADLCESIGARLTDRPFLFSPVSRRSPDSSVSAGFAREKYKK